MEKVQGGKNESIQIFRAIIFLFVFCAHAFGLAGHASPFSVFNPSVTPFFVLSAFLLALRHCGESEPCSFKSCFLFMKKRIAKLYPLHIFLTLFVFLIWTVRYWHGGTLGERIGEMSAAFVCHALLIHAWIPVKEIIVSLNGPDWFLSCMVFYYLIFPIVRNFIQRLGRRGRLAFLAALVAFRILWAAAVITVCEKPGLGFFEVWGFSYSPIYHLPDFLIGCLAGFFYAENKERLRVSDFVAGAAQVALVLFAIFFFRFGGGALPLLPRAFFKSELVRIFLSALWIYFFIEQKGFVRLFAFLPPLAAPLVFLGNLSGLAYLIHAPVMEFSNAARSFLNMNVTEWNMIQVWALVLAEFAATIILSILWMKFDSFLRKKKAAQ